MINIHQIKEMFNKSPVEEQKRKEALVKYSKLNQEVRLLASVLVNQQVRRTTSWSKTVARIAWFSLSRPGIPVLGIDDEFK